MGLRSGERGHRETAGRNIGFAPYVRALKRIDDQGFVATGLGLQYTLDPDPAVEQTHAVLGQLCGG
jgi:hypothetical protein